MFEVMIGCFIIGVIGMFSLIGYFILASLSKNDELKIENKDKTITQLPYNNKNVH